MMKITNDVYGYWKKCACVTISKRLHPYFDSCKVAVKDNKIFAYDETDGEESFFPVYESDCIMGDYIPGNFMLADDQLRHFVVDGKWGLFSIQTGDIVIEAVWDFIGHLDTDYIHVVKKTEVPEDPKKVCGMSFFDKTGDLNFHDYYEYMQHLDFCGTVHGAINLAGQVVIPVEFDYLREIYIDRKTFFLVQKENRMGLLSDSNEVVIPFQWEDMGIISDFYLDSDEKMIIVSRNQKFGVINLTGDIIIPIQYDSLEIARINEQTHFLVTTNGKQGIINRKNEILIPIKWDLIAPESISNSDMANVYLWEGVLQFMLCFEKSDNFENIEDAFQADEVDAYKFGIYDKQFNLMCPVELQGYSPVNGVGFEFVRELGGIPYYGIIQKDDLYGIIAEVDGKEGVKVVSEPILSSYRNAAVVAEIHQRVACFNAIIHYIKAKVKNIKKSHDSSVEKPGVETAISFENINNIRIVGKVSQNNFLEIADYLVDMMRELEEEEIVETAEALKSFSLEKQHLEIFTQLDELIKQIEVKKEKEEENLRFYEIKYSKNEEDFDLINM